MDTIQKLRENEIKATLSTLWIFILFNVIFRDLHEFARPEFVEQMINGFPITPQLLLFAGILLELPISMVLLSRVLPRQFNRWANIIVGALTITFLVTSGVNDIDDYWFMGIEVLAILFIIGYAWRWTPQRKTSVSSVGQPVSDM